MKYSERKFINIFSCYNEVMAFRFVATKKETCVQAPFLTLKLPVERPSPSTTKIGETDCVCCFRFRVASGSDLVSYKYAYTSSVWESLNTENREPSNQKLTLTKISWLKVTDICLLSVFAWQTLTAGRSYCASRLAPFDGKIKRSMYSYIFPRQCDLCHATLRTERGDRCSYKSNAIHS